MTNIKRRIDKIEDTLSIGKLPSKERQFIVWNNHDGVAEQKVKERERELLKKYGTLEGFKPIIVGWGKEDKGEPILIGPKDE